MTPSAPKRWLTPLALLVPLALAACGGGSKSEDPPAEPSHDASLAALAVSAGTLEPAFAAGTSAYAVALPNGTATFTVTATASHAAAVVSVKQGDGAFFGVTSGAPSAALAAPAVTAESTVTVRVKAEDGTTLHDYVLTVTQGAPIPTGFAVYAIGDSTMADYDPLTTPERRGWGQMFRQFLVGDVTFVNAARNGRSTKTFLSEGLWDAVKAQLQPGDVVLIQFAHNDEKDDGIEGASGIGTAATGAYTTNLGTFVDDTVAAGATPVLVTPVVRRYFAGEVLTAAGQHDLTGNGTVPEGVSGDYPAAMRDVATAKGVALVDMTASTKALVEQYGPSRAAEVIYNTGDDTHLGQLGAMLFAQLGAVEMVEQAILAGHLAPATDLVVSPAGLDFGTRYAGTTTDRALTVTGLALTPEAGHVVVTAPAGFVVAASAAGPFGATLQLPYTGGQLAPATVQVRFAPEAEGTFSGELTVAVAGGTPKVVPVDGVALASPGGTESIATWALTANPTCAATGLVSCSEETFTGMVAHSYQIPNAITTWNADTGETLVPDSTITQRITTLDGNWPADVDQNPDRYVEFAMTPAAGSTYTVDQVTLWVGAAGGNGLSYRALYSTAADFADPQPLVESLANVKNAMIFRTLGPVIQVADGETLRIRFYPWNNAVASGKYLCLQSLTVHGWGN